MTPFKNWAKNLLFLLVFIFSGLALIVIVEGLMVGTELTPFNTTIESAILLIRAPALTSIMVWITNVGSPFVLATVAVFLAIVLLLHRDTYDAMLFVVSLLVSFGALVFLKNTLQMSRPDAVIVGISGWSFPSGHATVATAFFFTVGYSFFDWYKSSAYKVVLVTGCILAAGVVSFSRIYLGAHWSLDILAGTALGLLSVSFVALVFNIFLEERRYGRRKRLV